MGCGAQKGVETKENNEEKKQNIETEININQSLIPETNIQEVNVESQRKDDEEEEDDGVDIDELIILKDLLEYTPEELEERIKLDKQEEEDIPEDINVEDDDELMEQQKLTVDYNSGSLDKTDGQIGGAGRDVVKKGKKNNKKKPFIITEIESDPIQKVKIVVNACSFCDEYMMPIWCPKDVFIKFKVEGKWRIDKLHEYTNSRGIPSNQTSGFNYGALVGRVGLGELFVVVDQGTYLVKEEGPLFLRQNLPKKVKVHPEGKLEITVFDGIYMDIKEINDRIGWKENGPIDNISQNENIESKRSNNNESDILVYKSNNSLASNRSGNKSKSKSKGKNNSNKKSNVKDLEKKLRIYLNNLRMNPSMYYEKYVGFNKKLIKTKEYLDKINQNQNESLIENSDCYNFIEQYFRLPKQKKLQNSTNKNIITQFLLKLNNDMEFYLSDSIGYNVKVKAELTQRANPSEIIELFLLDKKYRRYIFSPDRKYLSIKIYNNFVSQANLVIVAIGIDDDKNKNENENQNENDNNNNEDDYNDDNEYDNGEMDNEEEQQ